MSSELDINLNSTLSNGIHFFSAMLPSLADPRRLINFAPALFARLEKVQAQIKELESSDQNSVERDRTLTNKLMLEEAMLQQTLDWIRNCDLESNP